MARIQVLSPALVNRIAAGECVERPASVVKELVENALDAGAKQIDVTIEEGGRDRILVVDDGCGMDADDLRLCVASHATSKIARDDDLFNIQTLGFRGEALPSIASVARLRIVSRTAGTEYGHELRLEAGEVAGPAPVSCPVGTTVEVRDLFFNVPARRKFLRTNQTESGQITEQMARIALAQHACGFSLRSGTRVIHRLPPAAAPRDRIRDFYGAELADGLIEVGREGDTLEVRGYVAPPALCRPSSKWEYVFVNGRYVRDRFVSHAVKEAYRGLIQNEYPVVFLFLRIDPAAIDVNVHPTKIEVRWRDSNFVHEHVLATLRDKFLSTNLDRPFQQRQREGDEYRERVRSAMVDFFLHKGGSPRPGDGATGSVARATSAVGARVTGGWSARASMPAGADVFPSPTGAPNVVARDGRGRAAEQTTPVGASAPSDRVTEPPGDGFALRPDADLAAPETALRSAVQVHNTYLVVESEDGLMIVDQHALHERILYEEFRNRIAERALESQRLLLPDMVPVPADRLETLELHADTLARLGIELSAAGPQAVAVQAFPTLLDRADRVTFVRDLLDLLSERGTRLETESLIHQILDMMACKAAVKAGDALNAEEIAALLERRETAERSSHCPHGRPTTLHLTLRELERQFKRR